MVQSSEKNWWVCMNIEKSWSHGFITVKCVSTSNSLLQLSWEHCLCLFWVFLITCTSNILFIYLFLMFFGFPRHLQLKLTIHYLFFMFFFIQGTYNWNLPFDYYFLCFLSYARYLIMKGTNKRKVPCLFPWFFSVVFTTSLIYFQRMKCTIRADLQWR